MKKLIYMYLNHFAVHQRPPQQSRSTVLQLKKNKKKKESIPQAEGTAYSKVHKHEQTQLVCSKNHRLFGLVGIGTSTGRVKFGLNFAGIKKLLRN